MILIDYMFNTGDNLLESPKFLTFSGGEEHVQLEQVYPEDKLYNDISLTARIKSSQDFMRFLLTFNALKNAYKTKRIDITLTYLPYARQDRVCYPGQAFSLEVIANILNTLDYYKLSIIDAHSDVATKSIKNCENLIPSYLGAKIMQDYCIHTIVSPDKGATNRVKMFQQSMVRFNRSLQLIEVSKERDSKTGEIIEINVPKANVPKHNCLIIDDICDGGGTFIPIAKQLKERGAERVFLYVTHGIFSKGIEVLLENGIDKIYTTNTFFDVVKHPDVKVLQKFI